MSEIIVNPQEQRTILVERQRKNEIVIKTGSFPIDVIAKDATVAKEEQATLNKVAIMGGVDYEVDMLPAGMDDATQSLYGCAVGDDDYTLMEELALMLDGEISVGKVFKVTADNTEDGPYGILAAPKTIDAEELSIYTEGGTTDVRGVTEWLVFEKDKSYIVTGMYAGVADSDDNTYTIFTFAEHAPGRSVKEVYDKVEEVKVSVENINVESADQVAQFFGIAGSYEAEAKGGERTNNTVIDECKVRFQDAFNGLLPTGFTMPNSVTVDNLTYTGTTNS